MREGKERGEWGANGKERGAIGKDVGSEVGEKGAGSREREWSEWEGNGERVGSERGESGELVIFHHAR